MNSSAVEVLPLSTLPVEGPAKNELRRTIVFGSHGPKPVINERGLSHASPSHYCDDIHIRVCPCVVQESDILISTKKISSCDGQLAIEIFSGLFAADAVRGQSNHADRLSAPSSHKK